MRPAIFANQLKWRVERNIAAKSGPRVDEHASLNAYCVSGPLASTACRPELPVNAGSNHHATPNIFPKTLAVSVLDGNHFMRYTQHPAGELTFLEGTRQMYRDGARGALLLLRRIRRHSLSEMLRLIPANVFYIIRYYSPRRIRARWNESAFDRQFGLDTTAYIPVGALGVGGPSEKHASPYAGVGVSLLRSTLSGLPIANFAEFTFIDYGSGKGRALLIASEFGVSSIIGVEFSSYLHRIAQENVRKLEARLQRQLNVTLVNQDAALYQPPPGKKVAFFFNPFDSEIMSQVLLKLYDPSHTPDLFVIYVNPRNKELFEEDDWIVISSNPVLVCSRA